MNNLRICRAVFLTVLTFCLLVPQVKAQEDIRVMVYNVLRYGADGIGGCSPLSVPQRGPFLTNILSEIQPDIFGVNEIGPADGAFSAQGYITSEVLPNVPNKGPFYESTQIQFNGSQDITNMLWYNGQKLGLSTQKVIVVGTQRPLDYYKLFYKTPGANIAATDSTFLHVILVHFMSSSASGRLAQANGALAYLSNRGITSADQDYIIMGDMNEKTPGGGSIQALYNSTTYPAQTFNDPLNLSNWGSGNSYVWSQSTRSSAQNCGSGGGLDDRFDNIFVSDDLLNDPSDISYVQGSYWVPGNTASPNPAVSSTVSGNLVAMSDHYPVVVDLRVSKAVARDAIQASVVQAIVTRNGESVQLQVPGGYEGHYRVTLSDLNGRQLSQEDWLLDAGPQSHDLRGSYRGSGVYVLRLERVGFAPVHCKFVRID